jgi:hypothetical protein
MKTTTVIFLSIISFSCFTSCDRDNSHSEKQHLVSSDTVRIKKKNDILSFVDCIASVGQVENKSVGFGGGQSDSYNCFIELNKIASDNDLIMLTQHLKPSVRCYAFWALCKRNYKDIRIVLTPMLKDTASINYQSGCIVMGSNVVNFCLDILTPEMIDNECLKFSDSDVQKLRPGYVELNLK